MATIPDGCNMCECCEIYDDGKSRHFVCGKASKPWEAIIGDKISDISNAWSVLHGCPAEEKDFRSSPKWREDLNRGW